MTFPAFANPGAFARLALALVLAMLAAACGSGAVSGPTPVDDPNRITLLPSTAILYSGMPTTFTINGGTGSYFLSSSNQAVVRVSESLTGSGSHSFTVIPANVVEETTVTLTVRDSGTAPVATATLTVRPGTVANDIVIIPTPTQGGGCEPAVCSGGDAILLATISQGGNPLPARGVRLDVVSGDFRFITSEPGSPEVLSATTTVVSDQAGGVQARIRVLPGAANQTGIVQVTDLGTNAFRRASFVIAQATGSSPGFFVVPDTITFSGPNDVSCANGTRADVFIFGGTPPYTVGNAGSAFGVNRNLVPLSGGSFPVVTNGTCAQDVVIPVIDAAGRTATVTVSNELGTLTVPDLVVSPTAVTISQCLTTATVTVAGGTGSFTVTSSSEAIAASESSGVITIRRVAGRMATSPVTVGVSSGNDTASITVNLAGDALDTDCAPSRLTVIPPSLTLAGCQPVTYSVFGGTPYGPTQLPQGYQYQFFADNSSITVAGTAGSNVFSVRRTPGSPTFTSGTIVVRDAVGTTRTLPVTGVGAGQGAC